MNKEFCNEQVLLGGNCSEWSKLVAAETRPICPVIQCSKEVKVMFWYFSWVENVLQTLNWEAYNSFCIFFNEQLHFIMTNDVYVKYFFL